MTASAPSPPSRLRSPCWPSASRSWRSAAAIAQAAPGDITCPAAAHAGTSFSLHLRRQRGAYIVENWSASTGGSVTANGSSATCVPPAGPGTVSLTYTDTDPANPSTGNPAYDERRRHQRPADRGHLPRRRRLRSAHLQRRQRQRQRVEPIPTVIPSRTPGGSTPTTPGDFGASSTFGPIVPAPRARTRSASRSATVHRVPPGLRQRQGQRRAPTAAFTAAPGGPVVGQKVTFDASTLQGHRSPATRSSTAGTSTATASSATPPARSRARPTRRPAT